MKQYFYIDSNNQQAGPISEESLIGLIQCGAISSQTLIWTESLEGWLPFGEVFPNVVEEIPPANAPKPTAATIAREPRRSRRKSRNPLIIGGALALVVALSFSAYFASEDSDSPTNVTATTKIKKIKRSKISKKKAIEELQELGIVSSASDIKGVVGSLALADACKAKNIKVTKLLIIAGADTKIVNEDRVLPDVIRDNQVELVELLLAAPGIDVNITETSGDGHTPLSIAAKKGNTEIVKLLLAAPGIDVNKNAPLDEAAKEANTEIVKLLLAAPGIDVSKCAALEVAARKGYIETIKLLLAAPGIDVNKGTALVDAVEADQKEVVKLLLAVPGIDVNKKTPLVVAAAKGLKDEVRLLLAARDIDINKEGSWNGGVGSPLSYAVLLNQTEIVRILLADSRIKPEPEHAINAMFKKNVNMAKMLLEVPGIDVNQADSRGLTFLGTAAYIGSTELVELLLNKPGIDVTNRMKTEEHPWSQPRRRGTNT